MKKKLLTVLLAVVMVFGVFGLTACGGSNPDEEYNYYNSRYGVVKDVEGVNDVKITAVTYLSVYKMLQTSGNFIVYVDSEDGTEADIAKRFQSVNKLANDWSVEIYHFNPDLSGRYMENVDVSKIANAGQTAKISSNVLDSDIPEIAHVTTGILNLRKQLIDLTPQAFASDGKQTAFCWDEVKDHQVLAITGKEASYKVVKNATDETKMDVKTTYNGKIVAAKDYDKGAEAIAAVAQKVPSYGQYAPKNQGVDVPYVANAYDTSNINTFNIFGDGRFHMYGDVNDKTTDHYTEEKTDVFVALANYKQFAWLLDHNDGYFAVFFGGAWCPNTQAIATLTSSMAKDYGMSKVYFFDPILDDCAWKHVATAVPKSELSVADQLAIQGGDMTAAYEVSVNKESWSNVAGYSINTRSFDYGWTADGWTLGGRASSYSSNYSFSHLYGYFLRDYLDAGKEGGYKSYWNLTSNEANALTIKLDGEDKTFGKMAVPNIMIFNGANEGEGAQKAKLLKWAEAEYNFGVELQAELWNKAVREVFDMNPYASYNPIPVIEVEEESSSSGSSAPVADAGGGC